MFCGCNKVPVIRGEAMGGADVYFKGLVTVLICTLIFAVVAIPLALRKIPRNSIYGFRTQATLSDDFVWYEANAHFGRGILIAGIVSAVAMLILYNIPGVYPECFLKLSIIVLAVPPLVAALMTQRFIRKIPRKSC